MLKPYFGKFAENYVLARITILSKTFVSSDLDQTGSSDIREGTKNTPRGGGSKFGGVSISKIFGGVN